MAGAASADDTESRGIDIRNLRGVDVDADEVSAQVQPFDEAVGLRKLGADGEDYVRLGQETVHLGPHRGTGQGQGVIVGDDPLSGGGGDDDGSGGFGDGGQVVGGTGGASASHDDRSAGRLEHAGRLLDLQR